MASHDPLPPHTHGSVPCQWLAVTRAGLSSLPILALLGAAMLILFRAIYISSSEVLFREDVSQFRWEKDD